MTSPAHSMPHSPNLAASRRTSYQFPVYRWLGWLTVAGFTAGLVIMFFISSMFGISPPLAWAFLVAVFTLGALLLDRPKLLLIFVGIYFMLMPKNRILGLVGVPLPGFVDELFFVPFIAVIVMNWIQRRQLKDATLFPLIFCLLSLVSWYVNGRGYPFVAVQITLVSLKFYIIWYFCRLTSTFKSQKQMSKWVWAFIVYVAIQFLYNMLWQQGPWPKFDPDMSGGMMGPEGAGPAHLVGYMCSFALLLIAGWWGSVGGRASRKTRWWAAILSVVIAYNLIFMTDTKHALPLLCVVFIPFLLHPKFSARVRIGLITGALLFGLFSVFYFNMVMGGRSQMVRVANSIKRTPKAVLFKAVTVDFSHLVPYPLLGAGQGRFASNQGVENRVPLARRFILPAVDAARRRTYFGVSGSTAVSSVLGAINTNFFYIISEFGWLGVTLYYSFFGWMAYRLFQKSVAWPADQLESGIFLGLSCCVLFVMAASCIGDTLTIPIVTTPLWVLIGCMWDMKEENTLPAEPPV